MITLPIWLLIIISLIGFPLLILFISLIVVTVKVCIIIIKEYFS